MSASAPLGEGRDLRLLVPALIGWFTSALAIWLRPSLVVVLGVIAVTRGLWLVTRSHPTGKLALVVPSAVITAVMIVSVLLGAVAREQEALERVEDSDVTAMIRLTKTFTPSMTTVPGELVAMEDKELSRGSTPIRLVGLALENRAALGSTVQVSGYVQRAHPWEKTGWVLMVNSDDVHIQPPGWFLAGTDSLRVSFLERSLQRPGDGGELLPGLALGDTSAVDRGLVEAMRATSLSHLVAVSGANCAIVVALVVALVALFGGGLWVRMVAGVLALAGFVVLVTPEPSIIRASIMASIVLVCVASARPVRGIPVLGVTVLVLLALDPWLALDFAFALSVVATGGILLLTGPVTTKLSRFMPSGLALVLAVPLAAQIACQPILILLNPIIPLWAVVANAVAAPAAPVATILGMVACLVGPVSASVAEGIIALAWWPSAFIAATGRTLAATELSTIPWPSGWWGALTLALVGYCSLAAVVLAPGRTLWLRPALVALALTTASMVVASFVVPQVVMKASLPRDWQIVQCDVGQGDAVVIRSQKHIALIDTGKKSAQLTQCLDFLGINRIDVAVITHFDLDHVGGWPAISGRVDTVWIGSTSGRDERDIALSLAQAGATIQEVTAGDSTQLGDYRLDVLWPVGTGFSDPGNDSSVVVALSAATGCEQCLSGLFLGDLGEKPQRILHGRHKLESVDVVKVSHHGSADQFVGLYQTLRARVGLVGVGADNTYGHPTTRALDILRTSGTTVFRSDLHGMVALGRNPEGKLVVWSAKSAMPR